MTIRRPTLGIFLFSSLCLAAIVVGPTATNGQTPPRNRPATARARPLQVQVTVDPDKITHKISPYIYGASAVNPERAAELGLTTVRWGGNRSSRYNWKVGADNAGSDWYFLNGKAPRWSEFIAANRRAHLGSYLTVPLLPFIAKGPEGWSFSVAKYGPQRKVESFVADRGDGIRPDGKPIKDNDPHDASIPSSPEFQGEGIKALPKGDGPPIVYGLDNEPMLWNHTHRDVHPTPPGYNEVFELGRAYAQAIKRADTQGMVAGPCTWGWTDLRYSAADEGSDRYATHADHRAHGNVPFLAWYLGEMKRASDKEGIRLLDVVDVHFYPQGQVDGQVVNSGPTKSPAMQALRLRSTRGLWDRSYRDESWINEPVALIPRVRAWVDQYNPGTKLCIGEYNWGGDDDPSGAVAQAEVLGIFAREHVDYAYFWAGVEGVQRFAFQLFRNPDGHHVGFGDKYLQSHSSDTEHLSVFAASRNDGAITVVLVNVDLEHAVTASLNVGKKRQDGGTLFRLPNPPGPIRREAIQPTGPSFSLTVPALSAAMLVVP